MEHLHALQLRLSNERRRLADAKNPEERALRAVWVAQVEREIEAERAVLGLPVESADEMTADELLAELAR